jgi:uncharacterized protein YceK
MARVECWLALMLLAAGLSGAASAQAPAAPGASAQTRPHAPVATMRADKAGMVSVWIDLDLPELASVPRDQPAARNTLRSQIQAQQDEVMRRLAELGAIEQARVQWVRNALAVRLPASQMDTARRIPGVRAVRAVRHVERGPLVQGN